jgi:excisionase family DNA binding protein
MNQILLNGLEVKDLLDAIGKLIDDKLLQSKSQNEASDTKYISRHEVCDLLKISLPTLNDWSKLGMLQSYKIGNRVLYKKDEVENSLHKVTAHKYKMK